MPRSRSARVASSRSIALIGPATPPPPTLSKDDINALPIQAYEGDIRLIRDEEALTDALKHLEREDVLGFDTETRPIFTKGKTSSPALLQLAARDCVYLVQLTRQPFDERLAALLANPRIIKAGVAERDDLLALKRLHPFVPGGAVDLAALARAGASRPRACAVWPPACSASASAKALNAQTGKGTNFPLSKYATPPPTPGWGANFTRGWPEPPSRGTALRPENHRAPNGRKLHPGTPVRAPSSKPS